MFGIVTTKGVPRGGLGVQTALLRKFKRIKKKSLLNFRVKFKFNITYICQSYLYNLSSRHYR